MTSGSSIFSAFVDLFEIFQTFERPYAIFRNTYHVTYLKMQNLVG